MNGGKGKLLAAVLIMMMVMMPFSMTIGSDASDTDYSRYYYNQMSDDKLAQQIYDKTLGLAAVGSTTFVVELDLNLFSSKDKDAIGNEIGKSMQKAINALSIERPETYWIDLSIKSNTSYSLSGSTVISASTTFTYEKLPNYPSLTTANGQIEAAIDGITVDTTSTFAKVKSIHDALADILTYSAVVTDSDYIRSIYTALAGNHNVVCEGYAKSFKLLCDRYDVPCIIVVGSAGTDGDRESHMYNYVMMDNGKWYLVDVTWDDQESGLRDSYLLVGTNSIGFKSTAVGVSHSNATTTTEYGFTLPLLSDSKFDATLYGINYVLDGGKFNETVQTDIYDGGIVDKPIDPVKTGYEFTGWYSDAELTTVFDFSEKVHSNVKIYAKWTPNSYTIAFDVNGGVGTIENIVKNYDEILTLPTETPTKEGFDLVGWNTVADGTGTEYIESMKVSGDVTLYAMWAESANGFSAESTTASVKEFLNGEIVDGVSNKILVGGAAIAIIAIIAIAIVARR